MNTNTQDLIRTAVRKAQNGLALVEEEHAKFSHIPSMEYPLRCLADCIRGAVASLEAGKFDEAVGCLHVASNWQKMAERNARRMGA